MPNRANRLGAIAVLLTLICASCQTPADRGTCVTTSHSLEYCAQLLVGQPIRLGEDFAVTIVAQANQDLDDVVASVEVYPQVSVTVAVPSVWGLKLLAGIPMAQTTSVRIDQPGEYKIVVLMQPTNEEPAIDIANISISTIGTP